MAKEKQTKYAFKNVKKKFKNDALIERNSLDRQLDNMESILLFFHGLEKIEAASVLEMHLFCVFISYQTTLMFNIRM